MSRTTLAGEPLAVSGDAVIRAPAGASEIVIKTSSRFAGAIESLTWNGMEFIDHADHGRELQSASNLDLGTAIKAETFNPTEAGSRRDGAGKSSTSRLLHLTKTENSLQTTTQMAFWLTPEEKSAGNPAKNKTLLSDQRLTKRVRIGRPAQPHLISYDVTFSLPVGEQHTQSVFEILTGYMPAEFSQFWRYNAEKGELETVPEAQGEQPAPLVFSTTTGSHAMGIYSPDQPAQGTRITYGRFRFPAEKVVKWNCVHRLFGKDVVPGDYSYHTFVIVGDLPTVTASMRSLHQK